MDPRVDFNVRVWSKRTASQTYVFCKGRNSENTSSKKNVQFVDDARIYKTDTISILYKKLCLHIKDLGNPCDIYCWIEEPAGSDPVIIYNFIYNVFKKAKHVSTSELFALVQHKFGVELASSVSMQDVGPTISKENATKILFECKEIKHALTPLGFHYEDASGFVAYHAVNPFQTVPFTLNKSSSSHAIYTYKLLLKTFDVAASHTIHVVHKSAVASDKHHIYFPSNVLGTLHKDDIRLLTNISKVEDEIGGVQVPASTTVTNHVNFLNIKGNDLGLNRKVGLDAFFDTFVTSHDIPFIKLKTATNVFYKLHKQSVMYINSDDLVKRWTKTPTDRDDTTHITLKIRYIDDVFCTFTLHSDLSFNVKLSINMKHKQSIHDIEQFLPKLNAVLDKVDETFGTDAFIARIPIDILRESRESDVIRVVQMITSNTITTPDIKVNYNNFVPLIQAMFYPFFGIIETKDSNMLHLQYKRVNNYARFSNVDAFITLHKSLIHEDLVQSLVNTFLISVEEAEREIAKWQASHEADVTSGMTNKAPFTKFYFNQIEQTNIRLRLNTPGDMKYLVNGMVDEQTLMDIQALLTKLTVLSQTKKRVTAKSKSDNELYEDHIEAIQSQSPEETTHGTYEDIEHSLEDANTDQAHGVDDDYDEELAELERQFADMPADNDDAVNNDDSDKTAAPTEPTDGDHDSTNGSASNRGKDANLKGYLLGKLYEADRNLFSYKVPNEKKRKDYATVCGKVAMRQPVVVTQEELDDIQTRFPNAIHGAVKTGSTRELEEKNRYICPKIWCPKSRVALSFDDYVRFGRKCPDGIEEPILFNKYFGKGDEGLKSERYPGFLDQYMHPDQHCLPCCFKLQAKGTKCMSKFQNPTQTPGHGDARPQTVQQDVESISKQGIDKYILSEHTSPLDINRFGLLPVKVVEFLQQEDFQGTGPQGTGPMKPTTNALLRKGIAHSGSSFLDAVADVLDNESVHDGTTLLRTLISNIDVLTFLSLENGRIMKMFIDRSKPMNTQNIREFYEWFKNEKRYIAAMNLHSLLLSIEQNITENKERDEMHNYHDLLREYIIYQSFSNFKSYLSNDTATKEHVILFDLVVNKLQHLINVNKYNIVVMEYNVEEDNMYVHCGVNNPRDVDHNYPFVLLLKRNSYYEPIYKVRNNEGGGVSMTPLLYIKKAAPMVKKLLSYIIKNCDRQEVSFISSMKAHLTSLGYPVKYTVIDYGYKTCGFIINKNVYIPFPKRYEMHYEAGVKYMYISDVVRLRCTLQPAELKDLFHQLQRVTKLPFYKISNFVTNKNRTIGLSLQGRHENDAVFVPLHVTQQEQRIRLTFMNGLYMLIGHQVPDERDTRMLSYRTGWVVTSSIAQSLLARISKDDHVMNQIKFLLDKKNPLPLVYKCRKLMEILQPFLQEGDEVFNEYQQYQLFYYLQNKSGYDIYKLRSRQYQYIDDNEYYFDHFDIRSGRLQDAIERSTNPHIALLSLAQEITSMEMTYEEDEYDMYADLIGSFDKRLDVPVKWRSVMQGFKVVKDEEAYAPESLYNMFNRFAKDVKTTRSFNDTMYHTVRRNTIANLFGKNMSDTLLSNPWLNAHFKRTKKIPDYDNVMEAMNSIHYYPSVFDITIMSELVNINVILIGRVTKDNPDGFEVLYHNSKYFIIMQYAYDRFKDIDRFHLIINDKTKKVLFRQEDLPVNFIEKIADKLHVKENPIVA